MTLLRTLLAVSLVMTLSGCSLVATEEDQYLRTAENRATQNDIRHKLGEPNAVDRSSNGAAQWRYDRYAVEGGSQQSWAAMGSWCEQYVLSFDDDGILRHWTHRSFAHGGENMPIQCDAGNEKQAL